MKVKRELISNVAAGLGLEVKSFLPGVSVDLIPDIDPSEPVDVYRLAMTDTQTGRFSVEMMLLQRANGELYAISTLASTRNFTCNIFLTKEDHKKLVDVIMPDYGVYHIPNYLKYPARYETPPTAPPYKDLIAYQKVIMPTYTEDGFVTTLLSNVIGDMIYFVASYQSILKASYDHKTKRLVENYHEINELFRMRGDVVQIYNGAVLFHSKMYDLYSVYKDGKIYYPISATYINRGSYPITDEGHKVSNKLCFNEVIQHMANFGVTLDYDAITDNSTGFNADLYKLFELGGKWRKTPKLFCIVKLCPTNEKRIVEDFSYFLNFVVSDWIKDCNFTTALVNEEMYNAHNGITTKPKIRVDEKITVNERDFLLFEPTTAS